MNKLIIIPLLLTGIVSLTAATAAGTVQEPVPTDSLHTAEPAVPGAFFGTSQARTTGAVSTVDGVTLGKTTAPNLTNSFAGQFSGLTLFQGSGEPGNDMASWLIRGDHVKKLEASSLPLGVMEEARSTSVECRLHSGDILVMLSDGISDVFPDEAQMRKMLEESVYIQPQRMADALIRNAILASGGTPRDDMTAQVLLLMTRQQG